MLETVSWLYAHRPRLLLYHRFDERSSSRRLGVDLFEAQVKLISNRFTPLTVTGLLEAVATRRPVKNAVVVTIDDGYADVYEHAFPILRHYGVPATLYATAGFIEGSLWLWPDAIAHALQVTVVGSYQSEELGQTFPLHTRDDRERAWDVLATLAEWLPAEKLQPWIQSLADSLGVSIPAAPVEGYRAMSWAQLREMADAGIEVGGHSWSHPLLARCDAAELDWQLRHSKAWTEANLGRPITSFAYPHGSYTPAVRQAVVDAGFSSAVVLDDSDSMSDPFAIPRLSCGSTLSEFRDSVYGVRFLARLVGVSI